MAIKTYPLNDIDYQAEDAELFHCTRTSGVYASGHFPVSVTGTDNNITIGKGIGWLKNTEFSGKVFASKEETTLNAGVPDASLPRVDAVVVRFDANQNETYFTIKQGSTGSTPTTPAVERNEYNYELHLYHIRRRPGATAITPGDITDLRMDANYCGLMADSVTQVDMSAINAQVREFIANWESQIANVTDGKMVESPEYPGCYYRLNGGAVEWLNPPMMVGEEYRLAQRDNGKRVYTKMVKFESINGYSEIAVSGVEKIVSISAVVERLLMDSSGRTFFQVPCSDVPPETDMVAALNRTQVYFYDSKICVDFAMRRGRYDLYVTIHYTRSDDAEYTSAYADGDSLYIDTSGATTQSNSTVTTKLYATVDSDGGEYVNSFVINGNRYNLATNLADSGEPSSSLPGNVGQIYTDLYTKKTYVCISANSTSGDYKWVPVVSDPFYTSELRLKHGAGIRFSKIVADENKIEIKNPISDTIVRGVATPTSDNDAANKAYVDSKVGSGSGQNAPIYSMKTNHPTITDTSGETSDSSGETTVPLTIDGFVRSNGTISTTPNARRTDYIEITETMKSIDYSVNMGTNGYAVAFFDADKNILSDISVLGTADLPQVGRVNLSTAHSNARYFVVGYYDINKLFMYYSCTVTYVAQETSEDHGLNVLIFGDSITDSANITIDENDCISAYSIRTISYENANGETVTYNKWPNLIPNILDCKDVRNYALNGASYKDEQRETGLERRNVSYQIQVALNDVDNPNGVFPSAKFEPDIIIFALGTNDGEPNDTPESALSKIVLNADGYSVDVSATLSALNRANFCEAVMWAFLTIKQAFPMALAFCVLPIQRANSETNTGTLHDHLLKMANRYGIIPIDGAYHSGIVRDLEVRDGLGTMLKDGLHPNENGQNLLCRAILTAIRRYYLPFDGMN